MRIFLMFILNSVCLTTRGMFDLSKGKPKNQDNPEFCINYIQQCSIVQLCIPRKLEAFCMPDVGGHVISREFSRDVQLTNIARCM